MVKKVFIFNIHNSDNTMKTLIDFGIPAEFNVHERATRMKGVINMAKKTVKKAVKRTKTATTDDVLWLNRSKSGKGAVIVDEANKRILFTSIAALEDFVAGERNGVKFSIKPMD